VGPVLSPQLNSVSHLSHIASLYNKVHTQPLMTQSPLTAAYETEPRHHPEIASFWPRTPVLVLSCFPNTRSNALCMVARSEQSAVC
jgi:hypothetical protein